MTLFFLADMMLEPSAGNDSDLGGAELLMGETGGSGSACRGRVDAGDGV